MDKQIVKDIISSLEDMKDANRIEFAKTSYPTSMQVIGVTVPNEKLILKELKKQTKAFLGREKLDLAKELVNTNIFECQHIAYEFIGKDKKALKELNEKDIDEFHVNLDNWVSVDCYSAYIVGYAWRENIISTQKVKSFYNSTDFWIRRISIVATVSLNQKARGGVGDAARTLKICELAVNDHEDMINKALSWALRELAKVDKEPVFEFLKQHKDVMHSRVLREVKNKLEKGTKN